MNASTLRKNVANTMISWEGGREGSAIHKDILKVYNDYAKKNGLAQAYQGYAWCDITASAAWIKNKMAKYVPIAMSCGQSISKAKSMGIWVEKDDYVPSVGDGIIYGWDAPSNASIDLPGKDYHDHIGIVISVAKDKKSFVVIEGNKGTPSQVGRRTVSVGWRYVSGFIHPDYTAAAKEITKSEKKKDTTPATPAPTPTPAPAPTPAPTPTKEITATSYAQKFSSSVAGTYKVIAKDGLNMRNNAGTKYKLMTTLKYGTKVKCYGYYSLSGLTKWLFVTVTVGNTVYNGFMHSGYLQKL